MHAAHARRWALVRPANVKETAMGWSDWKAIEEPAGYEGSAIYKVRLTWANGPASIPRFLDVDTDGLLCIAHIPHPSTLALGFWGGNQC